MERIIIAVVGYGLSGKDEVAKYLTEKHDFDRVNTGKLVREYITEHDLGVATRELMQKTGNDLRIEFGADYFTKKALEISSGDVVITGLRVPEEVKTVKKNDGFILFVDAPIEIRYERALKRKRASDFLTFEEFKRYEETELYSDKAHEHNLTEVIKLADFKIANDSDLPEFHQKIDAVVKEILSKNN